MPKAEKIIMSPNGPEFSRVAQGYWRMSEWQRSTQEHLRFINEHLELGVSTVDHAHVYGNPDCETLFGLAMKQQAGLRGQLQIVTKCGIELVAAESDKHKVNHYSTSTKAIISSVDLSLRRMNTDYIDALLLHRPDFLMDADEVARAFEILEDSGKVKYFGVSNFSPDQYSLLQSRLGASLVTNQVEINPLNTQVLEDGSLDQLQTLRVRPMAWSCLAGGRMFQEQSERMVRIKKVLNQLTTETDAHSIDHLLFAWVFKLPSKPVAIAGSGSIERVRTAVEALDIQLSSEQWYRLWVAAKGHGVP